MTKFIYKKKTEPFPRKGSIAYMLQQAKDIFKWILPIAFFLMAVRIWIYLTIIKRPDLLVESIFSTNGLAVLLGVSVITFVIMMVYICLPSLSLIIMTDCFKEKSIPKRWIPYVALVPIFYAGAFSYVFYKVEISQDNSAFYMLLLCPIIALIGLAIYVFILYFSKKSQAKNQQEATSHKNSSKVTTKDDKSFFLDDVNGWRSLLGLFSLTLLSGFLMVFTFFGLSVVLILPEKDLSNAILILFWSSLLGYLPALFYCLQPKPKLNTKPTFFESIRWFFVSSICIVFIFNVSLPTKFSSAALRNTGIYKKEEQVFLLRTPKFANGLYTANIIEEKNNTEADFIKRNTFKAYVRYAFGNILWLCKHPFDPDTRVEKDSKEDKEINQGCIQMSKDDVTLLTLDSEFNQAKTTTPAK